MKKTLPPRPNLDHLRRQAKALLAAIASGDVAAIATLQQHLPAATGLSDAAVRVAGFRLADAQSAIARQNGFAGWPHLSRHVDQLRALEGQWDFVTLHANGIVIPGAALTASRVLIDGDRFRTETPEATYEGVFNIDVETDPHAIDIEFVAGPEAGNTNFGIFRLEGDRLEFCLDVNGKPRPRAFASTVGSGHAYEILQRSSRERPPGVTGGEASASSAVHAKATYAPKHDAADFAYRDTPTQRKLQGKWSAVKIVRDGQPLPWLMLRLAVRKATKNEVEVVVAGQTMVHALVRVDESQQPIQVDYLNLNGALKDVVQVGIMKWEADEACFCMAAPGAPRPTDFSCDPGSQRTLSQWRPK